MTGPVRPASIGAVTPLGTTGGNGRSRTGSALRGLSGRIAGRMAREFRLLRDNRERPGGGFQGDEDLYEIAETARELNGELGGSAPDEGRLARSLNLFAQESASLLAARPGAASLDIVIRAVEGQEGAPGAPETVAGALRQIDYTTRDVTAARPR